MEREMTTGRADALPFISPSTGSVWSPNSEKSLIQCKWTQHGNQPGRSHTHDRYTNVHQLNITIAKLLQYVTRLLFTSLHHGLGGRITRTNKNEKLLKFGKNKRRLIVYTAAAKALKKWDNRHAPRGGQEQYQSWYCFPSNDIPSNYGSPGV